MAFLLAWLVLGAPLAVAGAADEFVRELRTRIAHPACPLALMHQAPAFAAMKDHHYLDLANLPEPLRLEKAEQLVSSSASKGQRTGSKTFPLYRFPQDIRIRRVIAELDIALKAQLEAPPSTEPLYISIVGLGDEAAELPLLVELVDEALERLRGPRRKEELAAQLNLRFGAYDVEPLALHRADDEVPEILRAYPWLTPERVEVRFFDMTVAASVDTWTPRRLLLVLARNTLRKNVLDRGWPLIALLERYLVEGGLFGIDYEAFSYLLGPSSSFYPPPEIAKDQMSRPESLFRELGTFGVSASDENILLMRRPRSDQTSYTWPYGAW